MKTPTKPKSNTIIAVQSTVIAMFITGLVAFCGGMHYANNQHKATDTAVKSATVVKN